MVQHVQNWLERDGFIHLKEVIAEEVKACGPDRSWRGEKKERRDVSRKRSNDSGYESESDDGVTERHVKEVEGRMKRMKISE